MYDVKQGRINIVSFNVDINNFRQSRNNVIFKAEFHSADQHCWNNIANITSCKEFKNKNKYFWVSNKMHLKLNALNSVETNFSKSCSIYFNCLPQITAVSYFSNCSSLVHFKRNTEKNISQPTPDVAATLGFGCLLVATLGNVEATLLHSCVSDVVVALTKIRRCYKVVFSTSIFQPDDNVVATSCFWLYFSDENLTVYQRHYEFSPKVMQIVF